MKAFNTVLKSSLNKPRSCPKTASTTSTIRISSVHKIHTLVPRTRISNTIGVTTSHIFQQVFKQSPHSQRSLHSSTVLLGDPRDKKKRKELKGIGKDEAPKKDDKAKGKDAAKDKSGKAEEEVGEEEEHVFRERKVAKEKVRATWKVYGQEPELPYEFEDPAERKQFSEARRRKLEGKGRRIRLFDMYTINKLKPLSPSTIDDVPAWFIDMCLAFNENREKMSWDQLHPFDGKPFIRRYRRALIKDHNNYMRGVKVPATVPKAKDLLREFDHIFELLDKDLDAPPEPPAEDPVEERFRKLAAPYERDPRW